MISNGTQKIGTMLTSSTKCMCVVGEKKQHHKGQEEEASGRESHDY